MYSRSFYSVPNAVQFVQNKIKRERQLARNYWPTQCTSQLSGQTCRYFQSS